MQRLVEGADQVLAARGVDAGLAADAGIHLGQQGGRDLHEGQAAQRGGGGEAGEVADHAAAERDHRRAALDAGGQQPVDEADIGAGFSGLARRHDDRLVADAGAASPESSVGR